MNRRSFFGLLAAAVAAPKALWGMVNRKARPPATLPLTGGDLSGYPKWSNKVQPPPTADEMIESLRRRKAEYDEIMARDVLGNLWGYSQEEVDREIERMKAEL